MAGNLDAPPNDDEILGVLKGTNAVAPSDLDAPPKPDELVAHAPQEEGFLHRTGRRIADGIDTVERYIGSVSSNPIKAGLNSYAQHQDFGRAFDDAKAKLAKPDAPRVSGTDVMQSLGVPGGKDVELDTGFNPHFSDFLSPRAAVRDFGAAAARSATGTKDPDSIKLTPANVAGGALDVATDPLNYLPYEKMASAALRYGAEAAAPVARAVGPKLSRVFTGVPEKDFNYYRENIAKSNAAGRAPVEQLKDALDTGVSSASSDLDSLQSQRDQLYSSLEQKMAGKKAELGKSSSVDQARQITASLEAQKANLGDMSRQADEALAKSRVQFEKDHLLQFIDNIGAKAGPDAIGDETTHALAKLKTTKDRIAEGMPDVIDGPRLRNVLQQLRRDIDFDQAAGQFNDTLNGMRKEFSAGISNALKQQSPEYAAYMSKMADMSDALSHMRNYFGTESKALGSLESMRKGKNPQNQLIEEAMTRHSALSNNSEIPSMINDFKSRQQQLADMAASDQSPRYFPKDVSALSEADANLKMGQDQFDGVKRVTPARSQSIAKRQGYEEPSIEDRRALKNLEDYTGEPYRDQIQARHSYQAFDKDGTRGSANTNRFKAAGALVGGALGLGTHGGLGATAGAAAGAQAGAVIDRYGGKMARSAIEKGANALDSIRTLDNALRAGSPELKPWADYLLKARQAGSRSLLVAHQLLLNTDPAYRAHFEGQDQ